MQDLLALIIDLASVMQAGRWGAIECPCGMVSISFGRERWDGEGGKGTSIEWKLCSQDVATDGVREASKSHVFCSPCRARAG